MKDYVNFGFEHLYLLVNDKDATDTDAVVEMAIKDDSEAEVEQVVDFFRDKAENKASWSAQMGDQTIEFVEIDEDEPERDELDKWTHYDISYGDIENAYRDCHVILRRRQTGSRHQWHYYRLAYRYIERERGFVYENGWSAFGQCKRSSVVTYR